jgi:T5SS/PEP-CTERM-associated repeat protein
MWTNNGILSVGSNSSYAALIVTNGGGVYDRDGYVGWNSLSNQVSVSGNGASWHNGGNLYIGAQGGFADQSAINIGPGGSVFASNVYFYQGYNAALSGEPPPYSASQIIISGGTLCVTNGLGTGILDVGILSSAGGGALFLLNSGTVMVDSLVSTNYLAGVAMVFNGGVVSTKSSAIGASFGLPYFMVGNGTNVAVFNLAPGGSGFHLFANGLTVSSNAMVNGSGTIIGATTINAGGTLAPGDGPGSITFSNNLTLAAGSTFAVTLNGTGPGQYDQIIGLGTISVSNAVLNVSLGYTPSPGDSYTIISNFGPDAVLGAFVDPQGDALTNGADFVVDDTTFQIDYAANADGLDVSLTALVPEPSSLLLTLLSVLMFRALVKRKRA